ncbi:MAG: GNAT family N-acetyltransferase [Chthoniobacterales bacterium]
MIQVVPATLEHTEAVTEIAHAAKRHWGYPETWIAAWRDVLTMRSEFIAANVSYIAIEEKQAVGFYVLTTGDDGIHLDHLWIIPAAMRRGIGRALFEPAAEQAGNLGFSSIKIEADPNAEGFCRRMGAKRVGTNSTEVGGTKRELPLLLFAF